ncbi:hypothetical protein Nepgr_018353 [Nepenthes gracilis]|uniref:RING-type domain-containing protein n=1 Tax=Nepenthes gracilis TaxID=150966 RepID=A0AAD3XT03_NEPGR|nr:hypothetical protein Nepgr_018353 [Nepenthes gracilis]
MRGKNSVKIWSNCASDKLVIATFLLPHNCTSKVDLKQEIENWKKKLATSTKEHVNLYEVETWSLKTRNEDFTAKYICALQKQQCGMVGGNVYVKTVCSSCFEYLRPIEGDLQVISLCSHVFHKLCLQQWLEYCTNGKTHSCLFCKQICLPKNMRWLYLQSIGDPSDPILAQIQNVDDENNRKKLWRLVTKLEVMTTDFKLVVDCHIKVDNDRVKELFNCKESLSKEVMLKNKALKQKESIQQMLQTTTGAIGHSALECCRLRDKNLALAKELAALQFSYKELMTQCNHLYRGEARSQKDFLESNVHTGRPKKFGEKVSMRLTLRSNTEQSNDIIITI